MNQERRKSKKQMWTLFFIALGIALAFLGTFAFLALPKLGKETVDEDTANLYKVLVLAGIFFLVVAFVLVLPKLIASYKIERKSGGALQADGIITEATMRKALDKYIPGGETLLAGIRATSNQTIITGIFEKCTPLEDRLIPDENGGLLKLSKEKHSAYDVYLGITQTSLVITECERNRYYYRFDTLSEAKGEDIQTISSDLLFTDIGTCFPLEDIQSCKIKKGMAGSVNCHLTMKNGCSFKLLLLKYMDLEMDMPHHTEYRDTIIAQLSGN